MRFLIDPISGAKVQVVENGKVGFTVDDYAYLKTLVQLNPDATDEEIVERCFAETNVAKSVIGEALVALRERPDPAVEETIAEVDPKDAEIDRLRKELEAAKTPYPTKKKKKKRSKKKAA